MCRLTKCIFWHFFRWISLKRPEKNELPYNGVSALSGLHDQPTDGQNRRCAESAGLLDLIVLGFRTITKTVNPIENSVNWTDLPNAKV